jgi:hypothetical protein
MSTNLPIVWQDKVNSPALLAYFQQFGEETYLSSEEINQIKRAINELGLPDGFIKTTPLTRVGNVVSIAALDFKWILNHNVLENTIPFSANILPATDGKYRSDILVANTLGSFSLYQGPEDAMSAIQIPTPEDTLFVTVITVYGSNIISIVNPNSSGYITKKEKAVVEIAGGGNSIAVSDESSFFEITGFTGSINYVYNQGSGYVGKIYTIKNKTGSNLTITHDATSSENNKKFFTFPNSLDFILKPNEQVDFRETGNARLDYIGVITDFTNYYNKTEVDTADAVNLITAQNYALSLITQIINGAPSNADTLKELNDKIVALQAIVGGTTADGDSIINTVTELLSVFASFPEGVDVSMLIASKVDKTDIYNALDCIVANKVLDARQGKVLNDLIVALTTVVSGKQNTLTDINFGAFETSLTAKPTPIDADSISIIDSADSNKAKKTTFAQIKSLFKSYFDTLYGVIFGIVDVAGTTYQFLLTDNGKKIVTSSATAVTVTIPTNAVVALPIGARIKLTQQGNGVVTLVVTGITIVSSSPLYTIKGQTITLEKTALNTWTIEGNNLNGEIILPAFPNTRNDGQIPTNRILSTDALGNLKMYTIATAPAPYMEVLIPDSSLPSITTNFTIKGAFFTPTMTVSIVGQTINYITFVSDNLIKVNVTTGATVGSYAVTLNNGLSATFPNALLLVIGTIYTPISTSWENITGTLDVTDPGTFKITLRDATVSANIKASFLTLPALSLGNFTCSFSFKQSPFELTPNDNSTVQRFELVDKTTLTPIYSARYFANGSGFGFETLQMYQNGVLFGTSSNGVTLSIIDGYNYSFKRISDIMYFYRDSVLMNTFSYQHSGEMLLKCVAKEVDFRNIKLIIH